MYWSMHKLVCICVVQPCMERVPLLYSCYCLGGLGAAVTRAVTQRVKLQYAGAVPALYMLRHVCSMSSFSLFNGRLAGIQQQWRSALGTWCDVEPSHYRNE